LIGAIPTTIGNLALQELYFFLTYSNFDSKKKKINLSLFHSNGISGSIPIQIGNAINLQKLYFFFIFGFILFFFYNF